MSSEPMIIFSGGMPRASYGDRHTVSIMQGDNHVVADLTSRVVDFLVISKADEKDAVETGNLLWLVFKLLQTFCGKIFFCLFCFLSDFLKPSHMLSDISKANYLLMSI